MRAFEKKVGQVAGSSGELMQKHLQSISGILKKKFSGSLRLFQKIKVHKSKQEQVKTRTKHFFEKVFKTKNKFQQNSADFPKATDHDPSLLKDPNNLNQSAPLDTTQNNIKSENPNSTRTTRDSTHLLRSLEFDDTWNTSEDPLDDKSSQSETEGNTLRLISQYEDGEMKQINKISLKLRDITDLLKDFAENLEQQDEVTMQSRAG